MNILEERKIIVNDYLNKIYNQEFLDIQFRLVYGLDTRQNRTVIDRLGDMRLNVKNYAYLLLDCALINHEQIEILDSKYNDFMRAAEALRQLVRGNRS